MNFPTDLARQLYDIVVTSAPPEPMEHLQPNPWDDPWWRRRIDCELPDYRGDPFGIYACDKDGLERCLGHRRIRLRLNDHIRVEWSLDDGETFREIHLHEERAIRERLAATAFTKRDGEMVPYRFWPDAKWDQAVSAVAHEERYQGSIPTGWYSLGSALPPPREWVMPNWVPIGCVSSMYGPGAAGKGIAALQLGAAVASGNPEPFPSLENEIGDSMVPRLYPYPIKERVAVFSTEDDRDEITRRVHRFPDVDGKPIADAIGTERMRIYRPDEPLWTADGRSRGMDCVEHAIEWGAALVILDNAATSFEADENDRGAVSAFLTELDRLAFREHLAILLLAHPSKSSAISGSTAWANRPRAVWGITQQTRTRTVSKKKVTQRRWVFEMLKSNVGPKPEPVPMAIVDGVWREIAEDESWKL